MKNELENKERESEERQKEYSAQQQRLEMESNKLNEETQNLLQRLKEAEIGNFYLANFGYFHTIFE